MNLNEFKISKFLLIFAIILSLFQGCQKESISDSVTTDSIEPTTSVGISVPRNFTMPTNNNGVLHFSDRQHLLDYVEFLATYVDTASDSDTIDIDSVLYLVERSLLFQSYRQGEITNEVMESFNHPMDYFAQDYIGDPIIKSVLNEYSEFEIGNDLFVYFAPNYTIQVYNNIPNHQEELRELEKGEVANIPFTTFGNDMKLDEFSPVHEEHAMAGFRVVITPEPYNKCEGGPTIQNINVRVTGFSGSTVYEINWGDGTTELITGPGSGLNVSHTYSPGGIFVIEVGATREDNGNGLGFSKTQVEVSPSCSLEPVKECFWVEGTASDGTQVSMSGELRGMPVGFGTLSVAHLRSMVFEGPWWNTDGGNQKWRKRSGRLTTTLNGAVSDNFCTITGTKTKTKSKWAKDIRTRTRFWNGDHNTPIDGTITASYSARIYGVNLSHNLVLDTCDGDICIP